MIEAIKRTLRPKYLPVYQPVYRLFTKAIGRLFYRNIPNDMNISRLTWFIFIQKIIGFNRRAPLPVNPSSYVVRWDNIEVGKEVYPGLMPGCYIQAINGIKFGSYVLIGLNVCIVSANHDPEDYLLHVKVSPIEIGDNV